MRQENMVGIIKVNIIRSANGICKRRVIVFMFNGVTTEEIPSTILILRIFAPRIFPMERFLCPLTRADTEVTSSGSDVPKAIAVKLIIICGMFSIEAIMIPLSTKKLAPK